MSIDIVIRNGPLPGVGIDVARFARIATARGGGIVGGSAGGGDIVIRDGAGA